MKKGDATTSVPYEHEMASDRGYASQSLRRRLDENPRVAREASIAASASFVSVLSPVWGMPSAPDSAGLGFVVDS